MATLEYFAIGDRHADGFGGVGFSIEPAGYMAYSYISRVICAGFAPAQDVYAHFSKLDASRHHSD